LGPKVDIPAMTKKRKGIQKMYGWKKEKTPRKTMRESAFVREERKTRRWSKGGSSGKKGEKCNKEKPEDLVVWERIFWGEGKKGNTSLSQEREKKKVRNGRGANRGSVTKQLVKKYEVNHRKKKQQWPTTMKYQEAKRTEACRKPKHHRASLGFK